MAVVKRVGGEESKKKSSGFLMASGKGAIINFRLGWI
jgi:hypothetical protein